MSREGQKAQEAFERSHSARPQRLPSGLFVTAPYWGIKKEQLRQVFQDYKRRDDYVVRDTIRDFVTKHVIPKTSERGEAEGGPTWMGLSLLMNQDAPQKASLMISHAWDENATDFFEDVLEHMEDFEAAFICALALYQGSAEEIEDQIGDDILASPFSLVLRDPACRRMLVVANEALRTNGKGLYSRLWCIWEIVRCALETKPIHFTRRCSRTASGGAEAYLFGQHSRSSRYARCGDPRCPMKKEENMIRTAIEMKPPATWRVVGVQALLVMSGQIIGSTGAVLVNPLQENSLWRVASAWVGAGVGLIIAVFASDRSALFVTTEASSLTTEPDAALEDYAGLSSPGYAAVDEIIRCAAKGFYMYRRPRMDLLLALCLISTLVSMILWWVFSDIDDVLEHLGVYALDFGIFQLAHESGTVSMMMYIGTLAVTISAMVYFPGWAGFGDAILVQWIVALTLLVVNVLCSSQIGAFFARTPVGQYFELSPANVMQIFNPTFGWCGLGCFFVPPYFQSKCRRVLYAIGYIVGGPLAVMRSNEETLGANFVVGGVFGSSILMILTYPDFTDVFAKRMRICVVLLLLLWIAGNVRVRLV